MNKNTMLAAVVALCFAGCLAGAQNKPGAKPAAATTQTLTGKIKADPTGTTFVILKRRTEATTVDAKGAVIKFHDQSVPMGDLTAGAIVSVTGTMSGSTLKATQVEVRHLPHGRLKNAPPPVARQVPGASGGGGKPPAKK